ncbi:TrmH family RNA methyltransferase [Corynebacterium hansenii]|uniref:TrmH family RNA methyltransferase n=1 Tax=Corynebacterium hansenii TaxID=394964 RepID=A0ABV7ZQQ1_9CORY|nr:RNA methyltransferase [Corynebacterium hansenii]WJZ00158.1 23S rRNA (guanosine-2'-O-)-methyltransferase RlmB [Corynebacterium hansenii]
MADDFRRPAETFTARTPRVVSASKLHRAAARRKAGRFLVEGFNSVDAAARAGAIVEAFATDSALDRHGGLIGEIAAAGRPVSMIDVSAAAALAETVTTVGLFAVCDSAAVLSPLELAVAAGRDAGVLVVPVECGDPGNAGTIIRMADALGAGGVVLAGDSVDPLGGKVVRSSAGSVFNVPVARERDVDAVLRSLAEAGFTTLATTMDAEVTLGRDDLPAGPVAWLFGNEAHGLAPEVLAGAGARVSIPIRGGAESLNLATAAAMCLWETARGK